MLSSHRDGYRIFSGICPDNKCRARLVFPDLYTSIECTYCGQRHNRKDLQNVREIKDINVAMCNMLRDLISNMTPRRGTEMIKVLGLSNYICKLLSPLLTKYGMDKRSGEAKLLSLMNQGDIFDCGLFGDRAFLIDQEHLTIPGFGRDLTGSAHYLAKTLEYIKACNDGEERLIPIHADGDGHCLVHAVSRALVGRELFWHPLRCSLRKHFEDNINTYKNLFKDFVDERDWASIIEECDPDFLPTDGELLGLRNIHIFGLANVLKRPIVLLDSFECMQSLGDYAALFLPSLIKPEHCKGKNKQLNRPLCIAWSSSGHNHYIPLVGIKKKSLPSLPATLLPKVWGVPQNQIYSYIEFDEKNCCTIGGDRTLGDPYILRLVSAMEKLFFEQKKINPSLVADVHHFLYQSIGVVGADREMVIQKTKKAVEEGRLYRCLNCDAICEQVISPEWFQRGGVLYNTALKQYRRFVHGHAYPFPLHGILCRYDEEKDELIPDMSLSRLESCTWCSSGILRKLKADGSVMYRNEDKTRTPSVNSRCDCGYKHYWNGKEYDNPPQKLNVVLEWNNKVIKDIVTWFEGESELSLNSNVFQVACDVVQKHFPGEFGSERLVQRVVEQILNQTKKPESVSSDVKSFKSANEEAEISSGSKIILSGTGILHKEELGVSETEKKIRGKIEMHASTQQKKHTDKILETAHSAAIIVKDVQKSEKPIATDVKFSNNEQPVVPKLEIIKIATSDGRQANLSLPEKGVSYDELQKWIYDQFEILKEHQKIKYGFPYKELQAPSDSSLALPLSGGDRIVVENASLHVSQEPEKTGIFLKNESQLDLRSLGMHGFKFDANDRLEMSCAAFVLTASMFGHGLWEYAKMFPHYFRKGGVFYEQMQRTCGNLTNKKHCVLRTFRNKVFTYSSKTDSLELCVEPYGHFPIHAKMDEDIEKAMNIQKPFDCRCPEEPAIQEIKVSDERSSSMSAIGSRTFTNAEHKIKTIKSDSVSQHTESVPQPARVLIRKGPGFSVFSTSEFSKTNDLKKLEILANQITKDSSPAEKQMSSPNEFASGDIGAFYSRDTRKDSTVSDSVVYCEEPMITHGISECKAGNVDHTKQAANKCSSQDVDMTPCEKTSSKCHVNISEDNNVSKDSEGNQEMDVDLAKQE